MKIHPAFLIRKTKEENKNKKYLVANGEITPYRFQSEEVIEKFLSRRRKGIHEKLN